MYKDNLEKKIIEPFYSELWGHNIVYKTSLVVLSFLKGSVVFYFTFICAPFKQSMIVLIEGITKMIKYTKICKIFLYFIINILNATKLL